jgi:GntR family colanic acid and biofilm gene transcriptional regulator
MRLQDGVGAVPFEAGATKAAWPLSGPCPDLNAAQAVAARAVPAESLVERAYARLRYALIVGQVIPGQRITLGALSHQLGTSMTPVRDALSRLAAADALQHSREVGVIVPVLNRVELDELLRLRFAIEGTALTNAAMLHRKADWRGFKLLHADLCRVSEGDDPVRFAAAVWALRVAMLGLVRSSMLSMFVDRIWCRLGPTFTQRAADKETRSQLAFLLGDIVSAIGRRDPEQAHAAVVREIKAGTSWQPCSADCELPAPPLVPGPTAAGPKPQDYAKSGADHV